MQKLSIPHIVKLTGKKAKTQKWRRKQMEQEVLENMLALDFICVRDEEAHCIFNKTSHKMCT